MPTRTGYKPGVPCWVDLASTDLTVSVSFYQALFGWQVAFDSCADAGGYGRFTQRGRLVAGIGPTFGQDRPSVWNTYFSTGDAESVADKVKEAGGRVEVGPVQVFDEGTMAVFQDPAGASFTVWEPMRHHGAQLLDEPGALCWSELASRDPMEARTFYAEVFGWGVRGVTGTAGVECTEWLADGRPIAGMAPMGDRFPPQAPSQWLVFFAVADCEVAARLAERCGGKVLLPPRDAPMGRYAVLTDPRAAVFAVMTPRPPRA
ncbi:VOC family protein [Sphaerisporangium perillae]|uniref:VOC family protein n=1 Tax=Sphaerisporangium perillae TaxID=2935860 RepID=UPI00200C6CE6|nr:VOC family protein [Sphaerisporangium perillae]